MALEEKYQYNQKELNSDFGLLWSDYGARWLDLQRGVWGQIDPLAEKYSRFSSYAYTFNNPLRYTDPLGMEGIDVITDAWNATPENGKGSFTYHDGQLTSSQTWEPLTYQMLTDLAFAQYPGKDARTVQTKKGATLEKAVLKALGVNKNSQPFFSANRKNMGGPYDNVIPDIVAFAGSTATQFFPWGYFSEIKSGKYISLKTQEDYNEMQIFGMLEALKDMDGFQIEPFKTIKGEGSWTATLELITVSDAVIGNDVMYLANKWGINVMQTTLLISTDKKSIAIGSTNYLNRVDHQILSTLANMFKGNSQPTQTAPLTWQK